MSVAGRSSRAYHAESSSVTCMFSTHPCSSPPALCRSPQQPRARRGGCEHDHTPKYNRCRLTGHIIATEMATKSNFKRAMPQAPRPAQPSMLASLRTTQMVDDSKAILPAGMSPM